MVPATTMRAPNHSTPTMLATTRAMAMAVRPARAMSRAWAAAKAASTAAAKRAATGLSWLNATIARTAPRLSAA